MRIEVIRAGLRDGDKVLPIGAVVEHDDGQAKRLISMGYAKALSEPAKLVEGSTESTVVKSEPPQSPPAAPAKSPTPMVDDVNVDLAKELQLDPIAMTRHELLAELGAAGVGVKTGTSNEALRKMVLSVRAEKK